MELHNTEFERYVLGAILLDNTLLEETDLREEHFYVPMHRRALSEIRELVNRGAVADQSTLYSILGGDVFDLAVPTTVNFGYYVEQVKELFFKRRVHALSVTVQENAMREPSGALIAKIEQELVSITSDYQSGYQRAAERLHGVIEHIEDAYRRDAAYSGIPTRIKRLDQMLDGLQPEELVIVGARPGSGKTALALHMADVACAEGHAVGFFSAEMSTELLLRRWLSRESAVAQWKLRSGKLTHGDFGALTDAAGRIYERRLFVDDTPNISLDHLVSSARRMKRKENIELLFLDYVGLVSHPDRSMKRHEQIAEVSRFLKGLARELHVPVVVLAQLNRDTEGKRPTLANLRDSGALEQDADVVLFLWGRDEIGENRRKVVLIVEKQRNGPVGSVDLTFDTGRMRFTEMVKVGAE